MESSEMNPAPLENQARQELMEMGKQHTETYRYGDAEVAVDYAYVPLEPKHDRGRTVAVFISGLPANTRQTSDQEPQEMGLVRPLLDQTCTDLFVMKPEGINRAAFVDAQGRLNGELPARALHEQFKKMCAELNIELTDPDTQISLYGYSEGGKQVAELGCALSQEGVNISGFTGVEACGITGYDNPNKAHIWPKSVEKLRALLARRTAMRGTDKIERPVTRTEYGHNISRGVLTNYSQSLEETESTLAGKIHGGSTIVRRLISGLAGMKTMRAVQKERLKLVWSKSDVYKRMLDLGIPVKLYSGTLSEITPIDELAEQVVEWKKQYGDQVSLITSSTSHFEAHTAAKGVGFTAALNNKRVENPTS